MVLLFVTSNTSNRDIKQHVSRRPRPVRRKEKQPTSPKRRKRNARPSSLPRVCSAPLDPTSDEHISSDALGSNTTYGNQPVHVPHDHALVKILESWLRPRAYPGNSIDPFRITLLSKYSFMPTLFQFQMASPSPCRFKIRRDEKPDHSAGGLGTIAACLTDEVQLLCLAAPASSAIKLYLDSHAMHDSTIPPKAWLHYQAVKGLRERVKTIEQQDEVGTMVLLAIFRLAISELANGYYEDARVHMRAFQGLARRCTGSGLLQEYCLERVLWGDLNIALETLTAPEFTPSSEAYPLGRLKDLSSTFGPLDSTIGVAFAPLEKYLGSKMLSVIWDLRQWAQVHSCLSACRQAPERDIQWLSWRGNSLLGQILSLEPMGDIMPQVQDELVMVQNVRMSVRVALIVWLSTFVSHPLARKYPRTLLPHLRDAAGWVLDSMVDKGEDSLMNLVLWILFVGVCTEQQALDEDRVFKSALSLRLCNTNLRGKIHFATVMNQFFYSEAFQGTHLDKFWNRSEASVSIDYI